jgi:hypothetical protein
MLYREILQREFTGFDEVCKQDTYTARCEILEKFEEVKLSLAVLVKY